jgi:hypothetical protein
VFRNRRRPVVYPQAEHARFAGAIAAAWRPEDVPLAFDSFVRGVTLHDRGYGELDDDPIGGTTTERWCEIQMHGFRASSGDAVVDLVVALHIRRLLGDDLEHPARAELAREIDESLGDVSPDARAADRIMELCDTISFAYCSGEPTRGRGFEFDGDARVTVEPWPLAVPFLRCVVGGFAADGYPRRLDPVVGIVELCGS